jgi:hypothetical protein
MAAEIGLLVGLGLGVAPGALVGLLLGLGLGVAPAGTLDELPPPEQPATMAARAIAASVARVRPKTNVKIEPRLLRASVFSSP